MSTALLQTGETKNELSALLTVGTRCATFSGVKLSLLQEIVAREKNMDVLCGFEDDEHGQA